MRITIIFSIIISVICQYFITGCIEKVEQSGLENDKMPLVEGSWSKIVNELQARFVIDRNKVINGTPIIQVYLELRNLANVGNPMIIKWDNGINLKYRLTNSDSNIPIKNIPFSIVEIIMVPFPEILIPRKGTLRIYVSDDQFQNVEPNKKFFLDTGFENFWQVDNSDKNEFYLSGTLSAQSPKLPGFYWEGVLEIPRVLVAE